MMARKISLRSFIKCAVAGITAVSLLSGCSDTAAPSSVASTAAGSQSTAENFDISITNEERLASTYDPRYMGAGVDKYGNEVSVGTGAAGQIADQALIDFHKQYVPKMYQITDSVYLTNSYGLSNMVMIEGKTGIIIVDSNDSIEAAQMEMEQFRTVTDKPVVGAIYTHWHYVNGTQAFIPAGNPENLPIIAHENLPSSIANVVSEVATSYVDRAYRHHGVYLPSEGEDAVVGCALGPFYSNPNVPNPTSGYIPPNTLIPEEGITKMTIDGVNFEFQSNPSDSEDSLIIWLPDEKVCINNLSWPVFANLYTLRGEIYRDPRVWIAGIDKIMALKPEHLLTTHGLPLDGTDLIMDELTNYRDGIQYLFDQTVRYINKGYSVEQILQSITLPERFVSGKLSKTMYGDVDHYIRGIYRGLIGWFDTDTLELHPVTEHFEAMKIVQGFGGKDTVLAQTKATLEDKQYAWAAQLAGYLYELYPEDAEIQQLKSDCLRKLGQVAVSTTTRNFYLCQAEEIEGKLDRSAALKAVSKDTLLACPSVSLIKSLRVSIDPEKCADMETTAAFNFTDRQETYGLTVRHGAGQIVESPESADLTISMEYATFVDIIVKATDFPTCIGNGKVVLSGDVSLFQNFMSIFDA